MKGNALILTVLSFIAIMVLINIANPKELVDSLTGINLKYIFLAILLYIFRILLKIWRLHILVNATGSKVKLSKTSLFCIIGISLNNVTPVGLGGEPLKAHLLNSEAGVPTGKAIASIFTERIMDIIVLTTFATISIALIFSELAPDIRISMLYPLFIIIGIIIIMVFIITHPTLLEKFGKWIAKIICKFSKKRGEKIEIKVLEMIGFFRTGMKEIFLNKKGYGLFCFFLTILICLIQAFRLYLIFLAIDVHVTFVQVIIASSIAMMFGVVLPWGAGNIAAITAVGTAIGIGIEEAAAGGILEVMTSVWIMVPCGVIAMLHMGIKSRNNTVNKK